MRRSGQPVNESLLFRMDESANEAKTNRLLHKTIKSEKERKKKLSKWNVITIIRTK